MKRDQGLRRLHMGCGEALTSHVAVLRPAATRRSHVRPRVVRRAPERGGR